MPAAALMRNSPSLSSAECREKEKPPRATEKKVPKEPKPNELKPPRATAPKLQQAAATPSKAKPRGKPVAPPSLVHPPASILTRVVARGRFQKVLDSLALPAGDTLELRCKGRAVRWRFPAYLEDEGEGRLRCVSVMCQWLWEAAQAGGVCGGPVPWMTGRALSRACGGSPFPPDAKGRQMASLNSMQEAWI